MMQGGPMGAHALVFVNNECFELKYVVYSLNFDCLCFSLHVLFGLNRSKFFKIP
jgi:hypothetical protein